MIERKIEQGEVLVAELKGDAAGYLRVEFLWSAVYRADTSPAPVSKEGGRQSATGTSAKCASGSRPIRAVFLLAGR